MLNSIQVNKNLYVRLIKTFWLHLNFKPKLFKKKYMEGCVHWTQMLPLSAKVIGYISAKSRGITPELKMLES